MAQIQGTVIAISLSKQVKKQGGGTYEGWELVYNDADGQVRTIAKPVQGLKFNPALKVALQGLAAGDEFTATVEKNPAGFNDVKGIVKGFAVAPAAPAAPAASGQPRSNNNYQGRDYETKEERSARQKYIVKQSSITNAIAVLTAGAKAAPKQEDVLALADVFVKYVFDEQAANPGGASGFDDFEDDIPL